MIVWKLTPLNLKAPEWRRSTYRGEVFVRAITAYDARAAAAAAYARAPRARGTGTLSLPWLLPQRAACEPVRVTCFPPEGAAATLDASEVAQGQRAARKRNGAAGPPHAGGIPVSPPDDAGQGLTVTSNRWSSISSIRASTFSRTRGISWPALFFIT